MSPSKNLSHAQNFRQLSTFISLVVVILFSMFKLWENSTNTNIKGDQDFQGFEQVVVKRVVDGDTIVLTDNRRLRYIGIDTPETVHPQKPVECFGKEAKEFNRQLVENKTVYLETDVSETDRYGRLLRYVWVDGEMVNEKLVREGYAYVSTFPPDVKHQELFVQAQQEARESNKGLWGQCPVKQLNKINQVIEQADQDLINSSETQADLIMDPAMLDL